MDIVPYVAIGAGVAILVCVGVAGWLRPKRRRGREAAAIVEECTIIDGSKACTRRAYENVEEMPPEVRAAYEHSAGVEK